MVVGTFFRWVATKIKGWWKWATNHPGQATVGSAVVGGEVVGKAGLATFGVLAYNFFKDAAQGIIEVVKTLITLSISVYENSPKPLKALIFLLTFGIFFSVLIQTFITMPYVCAEGGGVYESGTLVDLDIVRAKFIDFEPIQSINGPFRDAGMYYYEMIVRGVQTRIETSLFEDFIVRGAQLGYEGDWRNQIYIFLPSDVVLGPSTYDRVVDKTRPWAEFATGLSLSSDMKKQAADIAICRASSQEDDEEVLNEWRDEGINPGSCYARLSKTWNNCPAVGVLSYSTTVIEEDDETVTFTVGGLFVDRKNSDSMFNNMGSLMFISDKENFQTLDDCSANPVTDGKQIDISKSYYLSSSNVVSPQSGFVQGKYVLLTEYFALQQGIETRKDKIDEMGLNLIPVSKRNGACGYGCEWLTYGCSADGDVKVYVYGLDVFNPSVLWTFFVLYGIFVVLRGIGLL